MLIIIITSVCYWLGLWFVSGLGKVVAWLAVHQKLQQGIGNHRVCRSERGFAAFIEIGFLINHSMETCFHIRRLHTLQ